MDDHQREEEHLQKEEKVEDDDEALFAQLEAELDEVGKEDVEEERGQVQVQVPQGEGEREGFNMESYRRRRIKELLQDEADHLDVQVRGNILRRQRRSSSSSSSGTSSSRSSSPSHPHQQNSTTTTTTATATAAERYGLAHSSIGRYLHLHSEKELITLLDQARSEASQKGSGSTGRGRVVLHFSHPEFTRCKILDGHLKRLAQSYPETLFLAISPLNAPFLTKKLNVKVLPHLTCFVDGTIGKHLIGFEELGNQDAFKMGVLEGWLVRADVISPRTRSKANQSILGFSTEQHDEDDWA